MNEGWSQILFGYYEISFLNISADCIENGAETSEDVLQTEKLVIAKKGFVINMTLTS